jgi:hypothetical protein
MCTYFNLVPRLLIETIFILITVDDADDDKKNAETTENQHDCINTQIRHSYTKDKAVTK